MKNSSVKTSTPADAGNHQRGAPAGRPARGSGCERFTMVLLVARPSSPLVGLLLLAPQFLEIRGFVERACQLEHTFDVIVIVDV